MNRARFFESGNSWPKFWTVQNFWAEFPIDLRIARTHYGLCESVEIFTNWARFSHESKYLSVHVNSWDSGPVWNSGIKESSNEIWVQLAKLFSRKYVLTLKVPITTAADDKFCDIFLNFGKKIRYDTSWESSSSRRFSWNTMHYLLFLKKNAKFEIVVFCKL